MSIFSKQNIFSEDQAITATAISTNVIDTGVRGTPYGAAAAVNGDKGKGNPVPILVQVTEAFNTLTSLTITLETSANADLSSSTVLATEVILLAAAVVGKKMFMHYLPNGVTGRYLGLRYTVGGSNPSTGKIFAALGYDQTNITGA